MTAFARILSVICFRQLPTGRTYENVLRVPCIGGKKITWKKVNAFSTIFTPNRLYPEEVLDVSLFVSADGALCPVQEPDVFFEFVPQEIGRFIIGGQIKMLDFLFHDPIGHRIDVKPDHVETKTICF